ncbi:hypothetical protein SLEP1_g57534 [Rubroshorea leprosula]|uniref:Uncharacterized protein n=1 Tax=Rubroshorea leprosula TaxID=152421 RepID=A0AAV5MLR0_9ROSI|nr:hypothetical protein SLEP1_g57534 [Rubroshorea leprosula]
MEEASQSAEIESSCDVSITIQNGRASKEQKILTVSPQLLEGMAEISQLAKTEKSCHLSIAIQNDRTSIKQKLSLPWTMPEQKILRVPHQLLEVFKRNMPGLRVDRTYDANSMEHVNHIVHLLHSNWHPSDKAMNEYRVKPKDENWTYIRSATELREAGIKFEMVETEGKDERCLFDIKFEKGILEMPKLTIEDDTESLYRNLIACEQFDHRHPKFLAQYVRLMDSLINSGKDVELLCKSGVIDNWLGNDESVAVLFNRLGDHVGFSKEKFFYAQLFKDVNKHYKTPWNAWKANLRHKYFNTPWALISFLAATLLLLLTVLQTSFTILPHQS